MLVIGVLCSLTPNLCIAGNRPDEIDDLRLKQRHAYLTFKIFKLLISAGPFKPVANIPPDSMDIPTHPSRVIYSTDGHSVFVRTLTIRSKLEQLGKYDGIAISSKSKASCCHCMCYERCAISLLCTDRSSSTPNTPKPSSRFNIRSVRINKHDISPSTK